MFCSKWTGKDRYKGFSWVKLVGGLTIVAVLLAVIYRYLCEQQVIVAVSSIVSVDMKEMEMALEFYRAEHGCYPAVTEENRYPNQARLRALTTPIAYLLQLPSDVFSDTEIPDSSPRTWDTYYYDLEKIPSSEGDTSTSATWKWRLIGIGPDLHFEYGEVIYDASNGTFSRGDIVRTGGDKTQ